jgi:hypothetical protein
MKKWLLTRHPCHPAKSSSLSVARALRVEKMIDESCLRLVYRLQTADDHSSSALIAHIVLEYLRKQPRTLSTAATQ